MSGQSILKIPGVLGIDAGGTYTDLVFLSGENFTREAKIKVPTLAWDITTTIENGITEILREIAPERIKAINLATTFATNAIVENRLRPAGLLLVGYEKDMVASALAEKRLGTSLVEVVAGGHDPKGNVLTSLDEEGVAAACQRLIEQVEALAVSGYFSVRNPSHENRVKEIVSRLAPGLPVTCGHELATDLDAIKRGATAALNAGLMPVVIDLFDAVERVIRRLGLDAPLSIVRGDGSLVTANWARLHPVETILSGPAASAVGGHTLGDVGQQNADQTTWIVDMGGTTTDIISLDRQGRPRVRDEGATVGVHRTLVKAIDIRTIGLGGDSRVQFGRDRELIVGPRRVHSLCMSGDQVPGIVEALELLDGLEQEGTEPLIAWLAGPFEACNEFESKVQEVLTKGPQAVSSLLDSRDMVRSGRQRLDELEMRGCIRYSGFTPTDALNVLGESALWNSRASLLGVRILSRGRSLDGKELCREVRKKVSEKVALTVFRKSLVAHGLLTEGRSEGDRILRIAMEADRTGPRVRLELGGRMVGAGAPAWAFIDDSGRLLSSDTLLPEDAAVAGAVGAATGSFFLRHMILVSPLKGQGYRAHLPEDVMDSDDLEDVVGKARDFMIPWMAARAEKVGLTNPVISCRRDDQHAMISGNTRKVYLGTRLWFTADDGVRLEEEGTPCPLACLKLK